MQNIKILTPARGTLLGLLMLAGCAEEPVATYRIPKESALALPPPAADAAGLPKDHPPLGASARPPAPAAGQTLPPDHPPIGKPGDAAPAPMGGAAPAPELEWDTPAGWVSKPASGMRVATYEISGENDRKADLSVIVLGGQAGGTLPNVNRWRQQIGLDAWNDAALAARAEKIASRAGTVVLVDLRQDPPADRILGALFEEPGKTWFFKLRGDDALVGRSRDAFVGMLGSLRRRAQP